LTEPKQGAHAIPEITPTELKERLDAGQPLVLVDVREGWERDIADLPKAGQHRIPVGEFVDRIGELEPDETVVLYCRSGARSAWAARQLLDRGYASVLNLEGGVLGWRDQVDSSLKAY